MLRHWLALITLMCLVAAPGGCGAGGSNFVWVVTPDTRTIAPGDSTHFTVTIQSKVNINASVSLRATGAPTGSTVTFNPATIPDTGTTSTLTIQVPGNTTAGTYQIHIFATEANQTEFEIFRTLFVETSGGAPDFSLDVQPLETTFSGSGTKTFSYFLTPLNDFSGIVNISIGGLPAQVTVASGPNPPNVEVNMNGHSGSGGTFVVRYTSEPPLQGNRTITVTATSGGITHIREITLNFPATPG